MKKHEILEAAAQLGSAEEITEALKIENNVDQMLKMQELGIEVLPIQGGLPVQEPWKVDPDKKRWEKIPGGRKLGRTEWLKKDKEEAGRVGEDSPLARRHTYKKDGEKKFWWSYGVHHPLEWDASDDALDFLDERYHGAGAIFQEGLIGIDADTPAEVEAFRQWWEKHTGMETIPWTVMTPGRVTPDDNGNPVREHSAGGHLWVRMPEGWTAGLGERSKEKITVGEEGHSFDVKRGAGYFITAGSTRSEGAYELVGEVFDATTECMKPLVEALVKEFTPTPLPTPKTINLSSFSNGDTIERLEQWSENRPWSSIFSDLGWSYEQESCGNGCVTFIFPGSSSGSHSGVAHGADCQTAPVPDAITFYSSTAISALNLRQTTLKKYRFVLEQMYGGSTEAFFKQEPVRDTSWKKEEKPKPKVVKKEVATRKDQGWDTTRGGGEKEENEILDAEIIEDVEHTEEFSALEKWHQHLRTAREKFRFYITEEGSKAWAYAHSPSVVTIGSAGDLISEVRNLYGDADIPLKKDMAESVIDRLFLDLRSDVMKGKVKPVKRVNRFYTCPETGNSWVYTAAADTEARSPFIKISTEGSERSEAPEGVVFDSSGELGVLEVDTNGTIEDFWKGLDLVNIPKKDRLLVLGWLMTPVHATDSARPGILLRGGAGSGKTSTAVRLKEIIDPDQGVTSESLAPTGEKNAFLASIRGSDTKIPGNLSGLSGTMSDAISQAMTGARYERDEKYTENKLSWTIKCSMIFSTINTGMVLQGDIQSRLFPIDVPEIPEQLRALGDVIEGQWAEQLPRIRGGLFKLISEVKAVLKEKDDLPVYGFRMIPAAKAMSATEIVLDHHSIEYTPWGDVYGEAITGLQRDALPSEIDFILNDLTVKISGRPGEVLKALHNEAEQNGFSTRDWSIKSARGLSSRLEENRTLLETKLKVKTEKIPGKANSIIWTLEPSEVDTREINIADFTDPIV